MPTMPKREEELARPRSRRGSDRPPTTHGQMKPVGSIPRANSKWDSVVKNFYKSAISSGQADFYQDSDWHMFYMLCDELNSYRNPPPWIDDNGNERPGKRNGQIFAAIMSALTNLMLTEGDRRKARIELQKPVEPEPEGRLVAMADYRDVGKA